MNGRRRSGSRLPHRLHEEATAALRALETSGAERPVVLGYWPHAPTNPFQRLLYRRVDELGIAPIRLDEPEQASALAGAVGTDATTVLHLHWTDRISRRPHADGPRGAVGAFLADLDAFAARGGRLGWTVHNVLPHEARDPALEAELQERIAGRATFVHVLTAGTPEAARGVFTVPADRIIHVPHPSYAGAYADSWLRTAARLELGLPMTAPVIGLLGGIRAHKGLARLLGVLDAVRTGRRDVRLLVAGAPHPGEGVREFLDACLLHPAVDLHAGTIQPDDMSLFLRAVDVVVLPYERFLNSGVLLLALTFGVPVVAPRGAATLEHTTADVARTFEAGDDAGLAAAIGEALDLDPAAVAAAAAALIGPLDPDVVSRQFARAVQDRLAASGASSRA
jgi:glycosyltransferase involved in cell wall biosynthesis